MRSKLSWRKSRPYQHNARHTVELSSWRS